MYKFTQIKRFTKTLFDNENDAMKANRIMLGILKVKSPRISRIADAMPGNYEANYTVFKEYGFENPATTML